MECTCSRYDTHLCTPSIFAESCHVGWTVYTRIDHCSHCDPRFLDWQSHREAQVLNCLEETNGNVLCLQEVQTNLFDTFAGRIQERGDYTCIRQNTTHDVGCAIFLRPSHRFEVVETESRSRALIVSMRESSGSPMIIASVHLEAGRSQEQTRFYQVKSLLKRIECHRHNFLPNEPTPIVILAGDWNMIHDGPVFRWLATGKWDTKDQSALSRVAPPDYPFLPATRVHHHAIHRTYSMFSILDYIWISPSIHETFDVSPALAFESRKIVDSGDWWPNEHHPSDHWPIAIQLHQKRREEIC